ncbi:amidohydrolase [Frankia sp. CNm7]|uniref:amidohydrolase family protein n=1 Tax=Frankia nepalensis TaxID=1836974 RepID=UPI0019329965|nr:amidohydrolase family protein [Frankia nepalensis]MBL7520652.1 amidohydrolase [Frankia nepalensis]
MNDKGLTRRHALTVAGAGVVATTGGFAVSPAEAASAPKGGPTAGRIDTHHHAVPDAMRRWAVDNGLLPKEGGPTWAQWTLESTLETMEENRVAAGIASAPVPAVAFRDRAMAQEGVRVCNESLAGLVASHPNRFGFFANVATFHVDLAIQQVAYALDTLGADGVILMTTTGDRYLGDAAFDPLFAELNHRRAVVFTHPGGLPEGGTEVPGVPDFIGDFLLDTTRMALNLIASGTLDRYPDVSIILSHAGGFLPYAAGRAESAGRQGEGPDPAAVRRALRRFYYDTALPASPYATPTLLAAADPARILYGTDWPARPAQEVAAVTNALDTDPSLDRRTRQRINRDNALRLFPRLAARLGERPGG